MNQNLRSPGVFFLTHSHFFWIQNSSKHPILKVAGARRPVRTLGDDRPTVCRSTSSRLGNQRNRFLGTWSHFACNWIKIIFCSKKSGISSLSTWTSPFSLQGTRRNDQQSARKCRIFFGRSLLSIREFLLFLKAFCKGFEWRWLRLQRNWLKEVLLRCV